MLIEAQDFSTTLQKPVGWSDHVFRYCTFTDIDEEGGDVDSVFVSCAIERCSWYWGHFNCAVFVEVQFKNCIFRGTGFSGTKFIDCEFVDCIFQNDNLNSPCSFKDIAWYGCTQLRCPELESEFRNRR